MLHLLNEHHYPIGTFQTYDELMDYIHNAQIYQLKTLRTQEHPLELPIDLAETRWRFVYYKHSELNTLYTSSKEPPLKGIEKQCVDKGLDLIEIYAGNALSPEQIPVTSKLDVATLKKNWCELYCRAHGYVLVGTPNDHNDQGNNQGRGE